MFFWLKKVIGYWLMPLPFCMALLALGLCLVWRNRYPRLGRALTVFSLVVLVVCSNRTVSYWLFEPLASAYPPIAEFTPEKPVPPEIASARFIIVLGGGHTNTDQGSALSKLSIYGLQRLTEGVRLAKALPGATLIVSGPSAGKGLPTHASVLAQAAVSLGIDPLRIRQVDTARDTEDEAQATRAIAGDEQVLVVTSAWHMTRSAAFFHKKGVNFLPAPTDYQGKSREGLTLWALGCDLESFNRTTLALRERLGLLWGRMTGKIGPA